LHLVGCNLEFGQTIFSQQKRKQPSLPSRNNIFVFVDHTVHYTPPHSYRSPTQLLASVTQFRYLLLTAFPFKSLCIQRFPEMKLQMKFKTEGTELLASDASNLSL